MRIKITKPIKENLLTEELFATFPEWKHPDPMGRGWNVTDATLAQDVLTFPDETDERAVQAVIDAHDPSEKSLNEKAQVEREATRAELDNRPPWLTDLSFEELEAHIVSSTVGSVTEAQALAAVDAAASLADVKMILRNMVKAIYGLVAVNTKLARVVLVAIRYLSKRL